MPVNYIHRRPLLWSVVLLLLSSLIPLVLLPESSASTDSLGTPPSIVRYRENFDAVAAPQLPAGWTSSASGAGTSFVTATVNADTAPNSVYTPNPAAAGSSELVSPPLVITGVRSILSFRHRYSVENTWDGAVLEIKIGNGEFEDIQAAGGSFLAGGYTITLNPSGNPLANRFAWSGASQGIQTTSVELPASTFGRTVQFRWRLGANESFAVDGWWIDSVTIENLSTGANAGSIAIANAGTANPYPSQIQVSGVAGLVTGVTVSLENFSHSSPDDVDILLVSPDNRRIRLMSDAGGATPVSDLSLTFSDLAAANLPDAAPLASGIYRPTNFDDADVFPAPAPQGAFSGALLNAFYGTNPNGVWSLYVVDDAGENAGAIAGGWSLNLQSSVNACLFSLTPSALAFPATGGTGSFQINTPLNCGWSVSTASSFISLDSPTSGTSSAAIQFSVAANTGAARTGSISITDGINIRSFQIQQGSGCPFSLGQTTLDFSAAGAAGSVPVTAAAACVWQATENVDWIEITSPQQSGNGTATFNVLPNSTRLARTAIVTIGARTLTVNQAGARAARFDFDGDGRSDLSVFRAGTWYLQQSTNGFAAVPFGLASDRLVPADYDGDSRTDPAVYRSGVWYVLRSSDAQFFAVQFGLASDVPVPADYTGDGRAELAVFRDGAWYLLNLANGQPSATQFGQPGDAAVPGDYDGDGKCDPAVYRSGVWYARRSSEGFMAVAFGTAADRPVPGDFNGDGSADLAVYRAGEWHLLTNLQHYSVTLFGLATDAPVAADYDGDGKTDPAVYRDGTWYVLKSSDAQFFAVPFGLASDVPVPGAFVP